LSQIAQFIIDFAKYALFSVLHRFLYQSKSLTFVSMSDHVAAVESFVVFAYVTDAGKRSDSFSFSCVLLLNQRRRMIHSVAHSCENRRKYDVKILDSTEMS
jgi:hypothetical protein